MKKNNNRKFSVSLMNPPYGEGSNTIHLRFVEKLFNITDEQIVIMPLRFVTKINTKKYQKFKNIFEKYLISVEQQDNSVFENVDFRQSASIGIYHFSNKKKEDDNIIIKYLDGKEDIVKSLSDISVYSDYEKGIIEYLSSKDSQKIFINVAKIGNYKNIENIKEELNKNSGCKNLKNYLKENPNSYGIIVSIIELVGKAKCLTFRNGQIYNNYEDFINLFITNKSANGYNILIFDSEEAAKHCKEALKRPLLRFTFLREHKDRWMKSEVYKYVPSISWEEVNTDEDILIQCGCSEDKAKEYSNYCKEIIEKVDKK